MTEQYFEMIDGVRVELTGDRLAAHLAMMAAPLPLPDLTMRQFRLGLLASGLLTGVSTAIEALPEPDRSAAQIEYEYAGVVVRTDPWVSALATTMGLTDQEIDDLWVWASAL